MLTFPIVLRQPHALLSLVGLMRHAGPLTSFLAVSAARSPSERQAFFPTGPKLLIYVAHSAIAVAAAIVAVENLSTTKATATFL